MFRIQLNWMQIEFSNTINHSFGTRPYDENKSATDNWFMAFWNVGEGQHNYHHTFPQDYRGSEHFNVPTFFIDLFAKFGWAYETKRNFCLKIKSKVQDKA